MRPRSEHNEIKHLLRSIARRMNIKHFIGYQTVYWISNSFLDIKHFTEYQIVYWISNNLLGIKQFTGYQDLSMDFNEWLSL